MADIDKIAVNNTTYNIKDATARDSISPIADALAVEYSGIVVINEVVNISSTSSQAQDVFIIFAGTWNNNQLFMVCPQNGNTPIMRRIAAVQDSPSTLIEITNNSTWGISITGKASPSTKLLVLRIKKS